MIINKNIYLIGFMGVGKTSVSKELGKVLGFRVIEIDDIIEKTIGISINEIFSKYGEDYFRNLETKKLKGIRGEYKSVVSTGGGIVTREENIKFMKNEGVVVLLKAKPETIFNRLKDTNTRPILNNNMNVEYIKSLMDKRKDLYNMAKDIEIYTDDKSIEEVCREIIDRLRGYE